MFEKVQNQELTRKRKRVEWPFKSMDVGDTVRMEIRNKEDKIFAVLAQQRAGGYGRSVKKKFTTDTIKDESGSYLYIQRIE